MDHILTRINSEIKDLYNILQDLQSDLDVFSHEYKMDKKSLRVGDITGFDDAEVINEIN